jgi:hypothetical protein
MKNQDNPGVRCQVLGKQLSEMAGIVCIESMAAKMLSKSERIRAILKIASDLKITKDKKIFLRPET